MGFDKADFIWDRPLTRRQLMGAVAVGGGSLALVGCGDDDSGSGPKVTQDSRTEAQGKKGGTITLADVTGPSLLDIQKTISIANGPANVWGLVHMPVLRFDWKNGTVFDGAAEKWEFPDPTTMLIHMKKGIHFAQESLAKGREVEASDVVASLERVRTPNNPDYTMAGRFTRIDTYEAVDKYTVRVKFKTPDANFLSWMYYPNASAVLPKETLTKYAADMSGQVEAWFGAGPFVLDPASVKDTISMTVKRNANYDVDPGGLPYLDAINVLGIQDASAREAAFRTGQTDIGTLPALSTKGYEATHTIGSTEDTITAVSQFDMNVTIPPFNDPRVRQAFHRAIDREELYQIVGDGFACTDIILGCRSAYYVTSKEWDGKPGFRKDKKQDIDEAKKLLAAAGVDPTKLTLRFQHAPSSPFKVIYDMAVGTKGMLERNLGVKMEDFTEVTGYSTQPQVRQFNIQCANHSDGGLGGLILDDPLWKGTRSDGINTESLWNDKKTDELVDKQLSSLDMNERKKVWAELQRYIYDTSETSTTMPYAPIVRNYDFFGAKKAIKNWTTPGYFLSHYPWQFNKVWLDA